MITLSQEDRDKFAAWLLQDAEADDAISSQMQNMGMEYLAKKKRGEAAAKVLVARILQAIESQEVK